MNTAKDILAREITKHVRKVPRDAHVPDSKERVFLAFTQGILLGIKAGMRLAAEQARAFRYLTDEKELRAMAKEISDEIAQEIEERVDDGEREADERITDPPESYPSASQPGRIDVPVTDRSPLPGELGR